MQGKLDIAFLRAEENPDIACKVIATEPLVAILPSDHKPPIARASMSGISAS